MTYFSGCENELEQFISKVYEIHRTIKLDFNYSKTQIHFLDLTITKTSAGKLLTTLNKNEINRQSYFLRGYNENEIQQQISFIHSNLISKTFTIERGYLRN